MPFTNAVVISVNVQPGHQRDRKMSENSISLCKNFVALININIISLICQLFIYQLTTIFLAKYQLTVNPIRTLIQFRRRARVELNSVFVQ